MPLLEKRLVDGKIPAADRARIVDILAISDDKDAGRTLLKVLQADVPPEVRDKVFENLKLFLPGKWRDLRQSPELTRTIRDLLARTETRPTALTLIGVAGRVADVGTVVDLARSGEEPAAVRAAAVRTLGMLPSKESAATLQFVLRNGPAILNDGGVQALGELARQKPDVPGSSEALRALQYLVRDEKGSLATRLLALSALAGTRPGTVWLLDLHARGQLADSLKADTARLLRNSPYQDLRNRALVAFPPPAKIDPKKLPPIATLITRKGDPARGAKLLAESAKNDMQCLKCHTIHGSGGQIGPDLSMIGQKASKENLYESILYPSKAVADQFINWQIETKKGLSLNGLIVEETPAAVTLRDGNGKDTKIDKKDIESRTKSPKSLMPEDLVLYMTEDDLVDVVEYLFTLKTPAPGRD